MELFHLINSLLEQDTTKELVRLAIIYAHLIACCVAIGLVLTSDFAMIRQLLRGSDAIEADRHHLEGLKHTVLLALQALWVTGILIVVLDVAAKGAIYLLNPKLQAKVLIVSLLTLNGVLLHRTIMPALAKAGTLLRMEPSMRSLAIFAGTVSAVSWFYAAMLGVGRPLAWKYSVVELMVAYPLLILGGYFAMSLLVGWASQRRHRIVSRVAKRDAGQAVS
ncbi:hypothetical protein [Pseudomonas sp. D(2018)]|uniref:hypothetical protein n=1 Tax=Pseudomonas sp. D(2018) TaxID=2502238 RepID=UPI0010F89B83|nr:hypothetical protein [Pseudomonas sp. D(2018)]